MSRVVSNRIAKSTRLQRRQKNATAQDIRDTLSQSQVVDTIIHSQQQVVVEAVLADRKGETVFRSTEIEQIRSFNSQLLGEVSKEDVDYLRSTIIAKLTQKSLVKINIPLVFLAPTTGLYDTQQHVNRVANSKATKLSEVYSFLEHAAKGSSSSCLLVGNKHSGKSLVLENALEILEEKYNSGNSRTFMTVRLSGRIQTDDKMAVREIARQLDVTLKQFEHSSKLRGLYEETDDTNENDEDEGQFAKTSVSETFAAILSSLEQISVDENGKEAKSMALIFVLDDFEMFTRGRQTLLYNLFDLASNNHSIPISVIGLTTKVNIKESLEKRVDSRFSQRIIDFFGHIGVGSASEKSLLINYHIDSEVEYFWFDFRYNLCLNVQELCSSRLQNKKYGLVWNDYINSLFYTTSFAGIFKDAILKNFLTVKDHKELLVVMMYPISKISSENPFPSPDTIKTYNCVNNFNHFQNTNNIHRHLINNSLSELQLLLVICAARVAYSLDIGYVNFNLCYDEYLKVTKRLANKVSSLQMDSATKKTLSTGVVTSRQWSKQACRESWQKLRSLGLIIEIKTQKGGMSTDGGDAKFFQLEIGLKGLYVLVDQGHIYRRLIRV